MATTLTLEQILATPLGKTPVIEELRNMIEYIIINRDDIGALVGGGDPGWNSAIDTRWLLTETGGVATNYATTIPNSSGQALYEGGAYWLSGQITTNTGAATLNAGTIEGAVPIKKKSGASIVELANGDFPLYGAYLYYSAANLAWVLVNPTTTGITHTTSSSQPSGGNNGDIWYIPE